MMLPQAEGNLHCLALSPDEKLLALAGSEGEVILYDLKKKRRSTSLMGHKGIVWNVAFSRGQ